MAAEILIVNPLSKKKAKHRGAPPRKKRTAKHMAKRRKMTAKQLKFFGPRRSRSTARRSKPRRTTRLRRNPVVSASPAAAPRKKRHHRRRALMSYASSARRRIASSGVGGFISDTLLPAGVGAAGALALDMVWPHLPIPATLQSGPLAPLVRIGGALALGLGVSAVAGRKFGRQAMSGALTVTAYDIIKGYMAAYMPAPVPVSAPAPSATDGIGVYVDGNRAALLDGVGVYVGDDDGMGWISPAANAGYRYY